MSFMDIARFLVVKKLCSCDKQLEAIYRYIKGESPSTIEKELKVDRKLVKALIYRIYELGGSNYQLSLQHARDIIPIIIKYVEPIVAQNWDKAVCKLCKNEYEHLYIQFHMRRNHMDYVDYEVKRVLRLYRLENG